MIELNLTLQNILFTETFIDNSTQNDLIYIGHSMGTTQIFVLLSEKPEYNEKIKLVIALAPVAYMTHIKSPIRFLAPFSKDIEVGKYCQY